jgi:hypothetical protein
MSANAIVARLFSDMQQHVLARMPIYCPTELTVNWRLRIDNDRSVNRWLTGDTMLIRFSSVKTESITMFGNIAIQLIKMIGASGAVPGGLSAEDIPDALQRLREQLQIQVAPKVEPSDVAADSYDKEREPPIALATRAGPLISLLERASTAKVPVMWEKM